MAVIDFFCFEISISRTKASQPNRLRQKNNRKFVKMTAKEPHAFTNVFNQYYCTIVGKILDFFKNLFRFILKHSQSNLFQFIFLFSNSQFDVYGCRIHIW